jgi:hypothetical protein
VKHVAEVNYNLALDDLYNGMNWSLQELRLLQEILNTDLMEHPGAIDLTRSVLDSALDSADGTLETARKYLEADGQAEKKEESRSLIDKAKEAGLLPELEEATSKLRTISESYGATVNMIEARLAGEGDKRKGAVANGNP